MQKYERVILWAIIIVLAAAWSCLFIRASHGAEWCYASPRQFWKVHPGQHAYYRLIDNRKCWTSEKGRRSRLVWKTPTPQQRPAVIQPSATTFPQASPSRFEETFSALPSWDDLPEAKAFFSQQLQIQAWRQWIAESMARAARVRERWLPYGPPPLDAR